MAIPRDDSDLVSTPFVPSMPYVCDDIKIVNGTFTLSPPLKGPEQSWVHPLTIVELNFEWGNHIRDYKLYDNAILIQLGLSTYGFQQLMQHMNVPIDEATGQYRMRRKIAVLNLNTGEDTHKMVQRLNNLISNDGAIE